MNSYFEMLFKQMFIERYANHHTFNKGCKEELRVTKEYRKILDKVAIGMIYNSFENEKVIDAMLKLARIQRIILAFNIIAEMELAEISFLIDSSLESTYAQKSTALKRLKEELEKVS
ncbi:MAG: hypothetical protein U0J38_02565 [Bacteroidales bacterium]|nr:hypothetical protein [Bacteroidales bacterium]MEE0909481.1 hypothetical protein [Bacteroidales bacterium]